MWEEKSKDPAIYLQRIVTHPDFRGRSLVKEIISRGDNPSLIGYSVQGGFNFPGIINLQPANALPKHCEHLTQAFLSWR